MRFQTMALASVILLGGVALVFAASPRIYQDRNGASYMQDAGGSWYVQGRGDAWFRVQRAPTFVHRTSPMPLDASGQSYLDPYRDQAKGDIN
jgi:hypothetical protein